MLLFPVGFSLGGSLEFCDRTTTFQQPYYEWDTKSAAISPKVGATTSGIVVNTVDILPTALPRDATDSFGSALSPILHDLLKSVAAKQPLPTVLQRSLICQHGKLAPDFEYIAKYRQISEAPLLESTHPKRVILLQGPLFDSMYINRAFSLIRQRGVFHILDFIVVPRNGTCGRDSQMVFVVTAPNVKTLDSLTAELFDLGKLLDVHVQRLGALTPAVERSISNGDE